MNNKQYDRWVVELADQQYDGDVRLCLRNLDLWQYIEA